MCNFIEISQVYIFDSRENNHLCSCMEDNKVTINLRRFEVTIILKTFDSDQAFFEVLGYTIGGLVKELSWFRWREKINKFPLFSQPNKSPNLRLFCRTVQQYVWSHPRRFSLFVVLIDTPEIWRNHLKDSCFSRRFINLNSRERIAQTTAKFRNLSF